MGQRGINPKRWFYDLRTNIENRCPQVLAGAASEQWINAELFRTVAADLGPGMTACPEVGKCDLLVVPVEAEMPRWDTPLALVEVKLIYRKYPPSKIRRYIATLIQQLLSRRRPVKQRFGFLYAIYNVWPGETPKVTFDGFKKRVLKILRQELGKNPSVTMAKPALETLVTERPQDIGGARIRIAAAGQYLFTR